MYQKLINIPFPLCYVMFNITKKSHLHNLYLSFYTHDAFRRQQYLIRANGIMSRWNHIFHLTNISILRVEASPPEPQLPIETKVK